MTVFDLWLPILLSGLATHVISTLAWMVLPHHKSEWRGLDAEDQFQDWIDKHQVPPGQYVFPHTQDMEEMKSAGFREKQARCRGMLVLWPTPPQMGVNIALTLAFFFVAAFVIGYLASLGLPPGADFLRVFRFVTTAALLTHCAGKFPGVFWFRRRVAMDLVDGVAFAVATGLIFAALWPD
ncbi:MAG: hypothetical protein R3C10_08290 [Pirellulales bacterium]